MKTYLHTVHRPTVTLRRLFIGDCVLDFSVGTEGSMSRRTARLIAARNRHAENCFQSRKTGFVAAGHSDLTADFLASDMSS